MARQAKKFVATIRREREAKEIGLREMAKMVGISPSYLLDCWLQSSRSNFKQSTGQCSRRAAKAPIGTGRAMIALWHVL
jgi:hypothetical protein